MGSNPDLAIFFLFFPPKWDKKWVLACQSFGECTARVKLELTDFSNMKSKYMSFLINIISSMDFLIINLLSSYPIQEI